MTFFDCCSGILLLIIYTTFCDTFSKADSQFSVSAVLRVAIIGIYITQTHTQYMSGSLSLSLPLFQWSYVSVHFSP